MDEPGDLERGLLGMRYCHPSGIWQRVGYLLCCAFMMAGISGCAPLVIGAAVTAAGGYVWAQGNLELTVQYSPADLYTAVRRSLDELQVMVERSRHDRFGAKVTGRRIDGRKVVITISGETEYVSRMRVRIGVMGDRHESQIMMNMILRNIF